MAASSSFSSAATRADRAGAVHHLGDGAAARHLADVLAEVADGDAAIDRDLALVGLLLAGDHAEQRRLAGAVGADEADLLAPVERRGGLDEEDLVAVLLADVVETDHVRAGYPKQLRRPYAMPGAVGKSETSGADPGGRSGINPVRRPAPETPRSATARKWRLTSEAQYRRSFGSRRPASAVHDKETAQ